jgi:hypothetical protein
LAEVSNVAVCLSTTTTVPFLEFDELRSLMMRGWWFVGSRRSSRKPRFDRQNFSAALRILGTVWIIGFLPRSDDEVLDLGEDRLGAFETLFIYRVEDVVQAGFEIVPTYRAPM